MSRVLAISGRELRSYFLTPVGYIIISLFLLLTGMIFVFFALEQGQPSSMRSVFAWGTWVLLFVCPAISMRTLSEESRMGTLEMLMTSPLSEREIVWGKFLAAISFLALMFVPTMLQAVVLELYGRPDYGELACGYFGMLLAGSAYLASGMLASALTSSQVVAFLLPLFFWMIINLGCKLAPPYVSEFWAGIAIACDADQRLREFTIGLLDTSNVIFFITVTVVFLVMAVRSLESRRWA